MPLSDIPHILQAVFGIGLVIFVHEWGHFIAARLCGVRVEVFSIGFGPILLSWKRGETLYQLAAIPLGGFCRMAGEDRREASEQPRSDELLAKSVPQRFFIYSAGVIMNVVFVLVTYPIIFYVGVPFSSARIGQLTPGSPAWHAGVKPGSEIVSVNGRDCISFSGAKVSVLLGSEEHTELEVRDPESGELTHFELVPQEGDVFGLPEIGMLPDIQRDDAGNAKLGIVPGSPADLAGIRDGEYLVRILGSTAGLDISEQLAEYGLRGGPIEFEILGEEGSRQVTLEPEFADAGPRLFGFLPVAQTVLDVRADPLIQQLGLQQGDLIRSLNHRPLHWVFDLQRILLSEAGELHFRVQRGSEALELSLPALGDAQKEELLSSIALGHWTDGNGIAVTPNSAAADAGLASGDRVLAIDGMATPLYGDIVTQTRLASEEDRPAHFRIERQGPEGPTQFELDVTSRALVADYGIRQIRPAKYIYQSDGFLDAVRVGLLQSRSQLEELWMSLKGLVTQRVPAESMGGIVSISRTSVSVAEEGWTRLFFFLSFLSLNLAFLNILPIPVLDGGHLFFLLIEGIKGSPVSARVMGYSQTIGVALILSLMVYVTYNDIANWLFPQ